MERTISALATTVGRKADTVRYYERMGLLPRAQRRAAGYRLYDEGATERLRFIRGAKRVGLRLADSKELLDVRDRGRCPRGHARVLVERRLAEVGAEIDQLVAGRRQIRAKRKRHEECLESRPTTWPCDDSDERR